MATSNSNICCIHGCRTKRINEKLSFFPLPGYMERRAEWLSAAGRENLERSGGTTNMLCAKHFGEAIAELVAENLMLNGLPTKYLPESFRLVDKATQTEMTFGNPKPKRDVNMEILGRTGKKENKPENAKLTIELKRKSGAEIGESSKKKKI